VNDSVTPVVVAAFALVKSWRASGSGLLLSGTECVHRVDGGACTFRVNSELCSTTLAALRKAEWSAEDADCMEIGAPWAAEPQDKATSARPPWGTIKCTGDTKGTY